MPAGSRLTKQASHRPPVSCTSPGLPGAQAPAQAYEQSGPQFQDVPGCRTWNTQSFVTVEVGSDDLSHVQLFGTPWTVANQAPLSMGFSRQEYWSELPFPSPTQ